MLMQFEKLITFPKDSTKEITPTKDHIPPIIGRFAVFFSVSVFEYLIYTPTVLYV